MARPEVARIAPVGSGAPLLAIDDLRVSYGAVSAVKGVSLSVAPGEVVALLGANGAGKSTTLRTISGLTRPRSGSIVFAGERIDRLPPSRIVRIGVAHCPEGRRVFGSLSVAENLRLGAAARPDPAGFAEDRERMYELFPILRERMHQHAGTLSGGEQQMLMIGRALMARPKLLLLDEPSLGLSPVLIEQVFAIVRRINADGVPILLVEQNARVALAASQYGYVLENGEIRLYGAAGELSENSEIRAAYLGG